MLLVNKPSRFTLNNRGKDIVPVTSIVPRRYRTTLMPKQSTTQTAKYTSRSIAQSSITSTWNNTFEEVVVSQSTRGRQRSLIGGLQAHSRTFYISCCAK